MVTKNGDIDAVVDDDDDGIVVGVSNRHSIGPTKALSKVIDTEVPPLANPIKGDTTACSRPEGLMVMLTEWTEMSEPCEGRGYISYSGGGRGSDGGGIIRGEGRGSGRGGVVRRCCERC